MAASFIWWQILSIPRPATSMRHTAAPAPFTLVVLDPGHGGQDSGAICGAIFEKDFTLDVAQRVDRLLQAQGIATLMTRVGDSYVSLADRAALANRSRDCIFVCVHLKEWNNTVSCGVGSFYSGQQNAICWLDCAMC